MDYLVFLTGLFLLTAGLGCLFHFKEDRSPSRWPMFAAALSLLGMMGWIDLVAFSAGQSDALAVARALCGAVFAACTLGFCLSPLADGKSSGFFVKWAAILAVFAFTFIIGAGNPSATGHIAPILLAAFAGGWRIAAFSGKLIGPRKTVNPMVTALLLTTAAAVCLLPQSVETTFDVKGQEFETQRVLFLSALAAGSGSSLAFCTLIWRAIYQRNRSELSRDLLRRRRTGTTFILAAAAFTTANGIWLAHWLGNQAQQENSSTLLSALHLGSQNFDPEKIEQLKGEPDEITDKNYSELRGKLLEVRESLPGTRFAYLLAMRGDKLVFLVDAEDPANTDTFSPPGQPVEDYPENWQDEINGKSTFRGPERDQWGVWYSASIPILDKGNHIVALMGVDYPAALWVRPLAARRMAAMGVTLSVALLLIAIFAFHLMSVETARRVESLSERLSDAMSAAEFDTWECYPKPFKLDVGARIASTLGWHGGPDSLSFRKVWRTVHPEDRSQIFNLIRQKGPSEAEVRLRDSGGHWLWFMLRGRIVFQESDDDSVRLVGTILNIDERHRSRLEIDKQRRFAQHMMESVPNGLAVIDSEGGITYANPAFVRLARGNQQSLVGSRISKFIPGIGAIRDSEQGQEALLTGRNGAIVPVQVFRAPLSESGQNSGSILAVVDLTATKKAEQALLRSKAEASRLALVAKRTDNAVVITDSNGRIEWINEGFTKISGYTREEVIGRKPGSILQHRGDNQPARQYMREKLQAGQGFETELLNYGKNGRPYFVHIECQPLVDSSGKINGFMAIERDITHTRRSSDLLAAVASTSTTLLSNRLEPAVYGEILKELGSAANADRCYVFRLHDHPVLGTPAISQCAEWTSDSASPQMENPALQNFALEESGYGRWLRELEAGREITGVLEEFPPEEQPMLIAQEIRSLAVVPIFAAGQLWGFLGFDACNDDRVWEKWEMSILRSAAANLGLRQVAQNEADALVQARDEAHKAAIEAEAANRAKSTFLATMSHEIRTPLNAVIGMASLLETTSLNSQQQDFAETILSSGNFLLDLINDILDYSRIEASSIELHSSSFVLADVCRDAFDVIRPGAIGKQLDLIAHISPNLPNRLTGDRGRIRQILVNLLSNAVKFTATGFVRLIVTGNETPEGNWQVTFEVTDSGIGISPDAIGRLFRPFVQEDSSTTRRFGGSGLGLAISKRLAELMGGGITVKSVKGHGSTFLANMTLAQSQEEEATLAPLRIGGGENNVRILIVDDDELNLRILEETLAGWGLSCQTAKSAFEGIALWDASGPFDLVISDHHMPDMDGIEMTRHLRSLPNASETRFSFISSENHQPAEIRKLFDHVASKPIWPSTIHGILAHLCPGTVQESDKPSKSTGDSESEQLGQLKVLVAEDNSNNQKVIRLLLRRLGIEADIVSDGTEAVEAVRKTAYDVILLDIQMPIMDGLEACRGIRELNPEKRPVIIALTANAFQEDRDEAEAAGMDDYLAKPITLTRLRETLARITSNNTKKRADQAIITPPSHVQTLDAKILECLPCMGLENHLELLGDISEATAEYMQSIHGSIRTGNHKSLKEILHKLRGMLLQYGFLALPARLKQLEELHESITPDQADEVLTELQSLWSTGFAAIKEWEKTVPEFQAETAGRA